MNPVRVIILAILMVAFMTVTSEAGWLIYHKPEFKGKVIDVETKAPIEGAVVVVVYNKTTLGLGAGTLSSIIHVRETLTDKDGMFRIPAYTTIIQPFSWSSNATFIIFKPGYASVSGWSLEETLSKETDKKEVELPWIENKDLKFIFAPKLIELPKIRTGDERKRARMSVDISGADVDAKDLPLLYKIINDERKIGF
jgi:hypothetical protein